MRKTAVALLLVALVACGSKKKKEPDTGSNTGSGSSMAGSGSSMTGSGSSMGSDNGSGSSMGSGSSAGSGSDSGSAAGSGSDSGSGAGSGSGSGSSAGTGSGGVDFDKLTHDEKIDFMKKQVVPTMKPLFQDFDKKKYANFGCKTCHGKDPKATKYKMPSADLPKLDFAKLEKGLQEPKIAKWMGEVVKPQMAKVLNKPEYSKLNPKGFGCLQCHNEKK
jgi:hypothetical protein